MAVRLRWDGEYWIALCAAETAPKLGDTYIDDAQDHSLRKKYFKDFLSEELIRKRGILMTPEEIEEHKAKIDTLSQLEMARLWRFVRAGHPYFNSELPLYEHFKARFEKLGGMTPEISKQLGW